MEEDEPEEGAGAGSSSEGEDGDGPSSSGADPMDEGRGPMLEDDDDEYGAPAKRARGVLNSGGSKAPETLLYGEVGQLNPHAARQQRKARKKAASANKSEAVAAAQERKKAAGGYVSN
jgi:nuclear GTP-binding protein